jgi:hypothetical protein
MRRKRGARREITLRLSIAGTAAAILFFYPSKSWSCDVCGCYTPQSIDGVEMESDMSLNGTGPLRPGPAAGIYFAIAEQFTHFGTLQLEGEEVPNPTDQHLDSSITQLVAGYSITPRLAVQLNLPVIFRSFERPRGFAIEHGSESGIGDASLIANFNAIRWEKGGGRTVAFDDPKSPRIQATPAEVVFMLDLFSGVKGPTGATDRLKEEFHEIEIPGAPVSGIHGHDLTLGTGSWDGIFGGHAAVRYRNAFLDSELQFTLRGDGEHQYHFANDLSWSGGPGYYFVRAAGKRFGLQFVVSGEHKDVDRFRGKMADDTGLTSVFVGPRVFARFKNLSADIEADLPVSIDNTSLQAVVDYRIRGAVSFHF